MSPTLGLYLARQTLAGIAVAFLVLTALLFVFDMVELGRRVARDDDADGSVLVRMALLHLPWLALRAVPYAVLLGGLLSLARLSRANEVAVIAAAGVSTPRLLAPAVAVAALVGVLSVALLDPLASATLARYRALDAAHLREDARTATLRDGLWLRQADRTGAAIVRAAHIDPDNAALRDLFILRFAPGDRFIERIDAAEAEIHGDHWLLRDVLATGPGHRAERRDSLRFDTDLTPRRIQESFAAPETQSFWEIPRFIETLEAAGFSSLRHRLHWHSTVASPVLYAGMMLLAAAFALRAAPHGRAGWTVASGVACGFCFYIFSDVVAAYGLSGRIPCLLAAWAPAALAALLGSGLLLHARRG